jgi:hypothetical protein
LAERDFFDLKESEMPSLNFKSFTSQSQPTKPQNSTWGFRLISADESILECLDSQIKKLCEGRVKLYHEQISINRQMVKVIYSLNR